METNLKEIVKENEDQVRAFVIKQLDSNDVLATSNKLPDDDFNIPDLSKKLIAPPYDPIQLSVLVESSSILNQCISTMEVNIDTFGFELKPSVDEETFQELEDEQDKALGTRPDDTGTKTDKPNRQETEIEAEYRRGMNFFKYVNRTMSYTQLRRRLRRDYELLGNGYWEILRNHVTNKITGLEWVPAHTVRIARADKYFTDYKSKIKVSDTEIEERPDKKKFRRYAQIREVGQKPVWFKEFGDPRIMDAETGGRARIQRSDDGKVTAIVPEEIDREYPTFDVERFKAGQMRVATEVLHFCNFGSPRAMPYGIPRWIGNLISIIGGRTSEEINLMYFDNKTVPPGMLLVNGARLTKDSVDRITSHIKENVKGKKNFHSILVVEAEKMANPNVPNQGIPRLEWVKMSDASNGDALFQKYDQQCIEKVVSSFRFWGGYVARTKEINLATAQVARQLSEEQVFQPEREEYDSIMNRTLMVEMDFNFWEHKTKGPVLSTPREMAEILDKLKSFLTGAEGRTICSSIFGKDFEEIEEEWTKKPIPIVLEEMKKAQAALSGFQGGKPGEKPGIPPKKGEKPEEIAGPAKEKLKELEPESEEVTKSVQGFVRNLISVRKALEAEEVRQAEQEMRPSGMNP